MSQHGAWPRPSASRRWALVVVAVGGWELDAGAAVVTTRPLAALAELVLPGWGARIVSDGDPPFFGQDWPFLGPPS